MFGLGLATVSFSKEFTILKKQEMILIRLLWNILFPDEMAGYLLSLWLPFILSTTHITPSIARPRLFLPFCHFELEDK